MLPNYILLLRMCLKGSNLASRMKKQRRCVGRDAGQAVTGGVSQITVGPRRSR